MMFYRPQISFKPEEILDYLRKSQSDDPLMTVEEVLAKHETLLDEWDDKHLIGRVPEENRFREVVSGETITDRPEIKKVLRLIESPKYKAVKVVEPQRLSRGDLEDIGRLMKLFKLTNTYIITLDRIYDLTDEYDWEAFERELKRGNDYLKYTKKILNRGRLLSVSQGNYIANIPPYGYDKTFVMDGKRKCPTLKINPEEADVVRMIFDMYVNQNMGRPSICYRLDELGIAPPSKNKHWSPASLKDLLVNIHYIGKVKWGWSKQVETVEDGQYIKRRAKQDDGDYLVYEGKHEAIISEELFQAAQEKRRRNHRAKAKTKIRNPLAGLLWCKCGRAMSLRTYKKPDGTERNAPRLLCDGQAYCNTGSVLYSEILERVKIALRESIEDAELQLDNNEGEAVKIHERLIKNLEKKLQALEEKELAQWELQADPDESKRMPQAIFQRLNEKLLQEKEETKRALKNAYETMPEPIDYEAKIRTFRDALEALQNPDVSVELQNNLLKQCIERIEYHRDRPERLKSKKTSYYDKVTKKRCWTSPLKVGGNWSSPPIELDIKLKV